MNRLTYKKEFDNSEDNFANANSRIIKSTGTDGKSNEIKGYKRLFKIICLYFSNFPSSIFSVTLCFLLATSFSYGQGYIYWQENGVQVTPTWCMIETMISDGKGGAITFTGDGDSIFATKVDEYGNVLWGIPGVVVDNSGFLQFGSRTASDGRGGAIVSWVRQIMPFSDIVCQRIDSLGNVMWIPGGVFVCNADSNQGNPAIISDGCCGATIAWVDGRNGNADIYAQRIDSAGNLMWAINGVPVCTTTLNQETPAICFDGKKGAVITWNEPTIDDIFAQRVDSSGTLVWGTNGKVICATPNFEGAPALSLVDTNSIIIAWMDNRNGNFDIYSQRVNLDGDTLWPGGVAICTAESLQGGVQIIADGSNGAIILWYDERLNGLYDFYIQRVDGSGVIMWTANGVPVCINDSIQQYPVMISDGSGGAIIAWEDKRNYSTNSWDIYAQHIDLSGTARWAINGMPICTRSAIDRYARITTDRAGGAIISWIGGCGYVQRVNDAPPLWPDIWLSDTLYDFGNVIVGDSAFWQYLVIRNLGNVDLIIDNLISTDSVFSVVSPSSPDTIIPMDSLNVSVRFVPLNIGYVFGFLNVYSNDPDEESLIVRLSGNGVLSIEEDDKVKFQNVALFPIFPNPFVKSAKIRYCLPTQAEVSLIIYNSLGQEVRRLVSDIQRAGCYTVNWDAMDNDGIVMSHGAYFCILKTERHNFVKKILFIKK